MPDYCLLCVGDQQRAAQYNQTNIRVRTDVCLIADIIYQLPTLASVSRIHKASLRLFAVIRENHIAPFDDGLQMTGSPPHSE